MLRSIVIKKALEETVKGWLELVGTGVKKDIAQPLSAYSLAAGGTLERSPRGSSTHKGQIIGPKEAQGAFPSPLLQPGVVPEFNSYAVLR